MRQIVGSKRGQREAVQCPNCRHPDRLRPDRSPSTAARSEEPQLEQQRHEQEIWLQREAEGGAHPDRGGQPRRHFVPAAAHRSQGGIWQSADEDDLLTLAKVHPWHCRKDQRGIAEEERPLRPGAGDEA